MDEIKQRLSEASEACIKAYEAWFADDKLPTAREGLLDAVHELRKVAARLEIELAVSERKLHGSEPLPVPAHRAARRQMPEGDGPDGQNEGAGRTSRGGGRRGGARRQMPEGAQADAPAPTPKADEGSKAGGRRPRPLSLKRSADESDEAAE